MMILARVARAGQAKRCHTPVFRLVDCDAVLELVMQARTPFLLEENQPSHVLSLPAVAGQRRSDRTLRIPRSHPAFLGALGYWMKVPPWPHAAAHGTRGNDGPPVAAASDIFDKTRAARGAGSRLLLLP